MNTERRYTLEEAREEFKKRECLERGHDFRVAGLSSFGGHSFPELVYCDRCSRSWNIGEGRGGVCLGETVNGEERWDT